VKENISIVCRDSKRVDDILRDYQLNPYARSSISELSGGLKQRVALARAIARGSSAIIFDEPTKSFDPDWVDFFVRWITDPEKVAGLTRIVITHDNDLLAQLGSHEPQIYILEKEADGFSRLSSPCKFEDLIKNPPSYYAAKFVGYENIYSVRQDKIEEVRKNIGNLDCGDLAPLGASTLLVVIPPDCIEIRDAGGAEVRLVSQRPSIGNYIVAKYRWYPGQFTLEFCVRVKGAPPESGYLYFDPNKCILIDRGG
jgi:ABC-type sugar transport system ATPase subunit